MGAINIIRYVSLGLLVAFSIVTLALAASILTGFRDVIVIPVYPALDLAIGIITLVVVIPSLIVNLFRKGAFTSMVAVEIGWSTVLMTLWVAAAGETTGALAALNCTPARFGSVTIFGEGLSYCHQEQALQAFPWLNFVILVGWNTTLWCLAIIAHVRGNASVWKSSVTGTDFFRRAKTQSTPSQNEYGGVQYGAASQNLYSVQPMSNSMQQQQPSGYQQGYPPTSGYPYHPSAAQV